MTDIRLGRLPSPEEERDKYLRRFALTPETAPSKPVFVVFGWDWFSNWMDVKPGKDGHAWIGKGKPRSWGKVVGGHAIMAPPVNVPYKPEIARYYNQGQTPECVAYSHSYGMTLLNSDNLDAPVLYQPDWLYNKCQQVYDKIPGPPPKYEGTEVRAADECLRVEGIVRKGENFARKDDGIAAYRWAKSVEEIHAALGTDINLGYVVLNQSWGLNWGEHGQVRIPNEAVAYLMGRPYADAVVPTDR